MPAPSFWNDATEVAPGHSSQAIELQDGGFAIIYKVQTTATTYDLTIKFFDAAGEEFNSTVIQAGITEDDSSYSLATVGASLVNGDLIILWTAPYTLRDQSTLYATRFDQDGNRIGSDLALVEPNPMTPDVNLYQDFHITALANGGFVVAWSDFLDLAPWDNNSFIQFYDADGVATSSAIEIGAGVTDYAPITAQLNDGTVVVGWAEWTTNGYHLEFRDTSGNLLPEAQIDIPTLASFAIVSDIHALASGGFVIVWTDYLDNANPTPDQRTTYMQIYDGDYQAATSAIVVNDSQYRGAFYPSVVELHDGDILVVWESTDGTPIGEPGSFNSLWGQRYNSDGSLDGAAFEIGGTGNANADSINASLLDDGRVVLAWSEAGITSFRILDPRESGVNFTGDASNERWYGTGFVDQLDGGAGDDQLYGGAAADVLIGGDGEDTLDGGAGADSMAGGDQSDLYIVDDVGDTITENADDGFDYVFSSVSYTLSANVEYLTLQGSANLNGTGNATTNVINGNSGNNFMQGLADNDELYGEGGSDWLDGGSGADIVDGGDGVDTAAFGGSIAAVSVDLLAGTYSGGDATGDALYNIENLSGSSWNDNLFGDANANTLHGQGGADFMQGRAGADILNGGEGNDWLDGGLGADTINGGNGVDTAAYGASTVAVSLDLLTGIYTGGDAAGDTLFSIENLSGSGQADTINGNAANNTLSGQGGNDVMQGRAGADILNGGEGNDWLDGGTGADTINGGNGVDTAAYGASTVAVSIDLLNNTLSGGDAAGDTLVAIESLSGSGFNDTLNGNASNNTLHGQGGNDVMQGRAGVDTLNGGEGNDWLDGGTGADVINGGNGSDTAAFGGSTVAVSADLQSGAYSGGEAAGDTLTSIENLSGSGWNDNLFGDANANTLHGQGGNDFMQGRGGVDTLNGGEGNDWLDGGAGGDVINGGNGTDTAAYGASASGVNINMLTSALSGGDAAGDTLVSIENLSGSSHTDTLTGNASANTLNGQGGADTLNGGAGNDILIGGAGNDTFVFGVGDGDDVINDFVAGGTDDSVDLTAYNGSGITWTVDQVGGDTVFNFSNGDSITLLNVTATNLLYDGLFTYS